MDLSGEFSVKLLCEMMGIQRSSFYYWKKKLSDPAPRTKNFLENVWLFQEYHFRYPSHGYRWLNTKIRLDTGLVLSDQYAHKCCKTAGIKSKSKHYRYKKPGDPLLSISKQSLIPSFSARALSVTVLSRETSTTMKM